jgi:hypothetical protein
MVLYKNFLVNQNSKIAKGKEKGFNIVHVLYGKMKMSFSHKPEI